MWVSHSTHYLPVHLTASCTVCLDMMTWEVKQAEGPGLCNKPASERCTCLWPALSTGHQLRSLDVPLWDYSSLIFLSQGRVLSNLICLSFRTVSLALCLSLSLFVCLSVCLYLSLFICLSVSLSISVCLSVSLSISLSFRPFCMFSLPVSPFSLSYSFKL